MRYKVVRKILIFWCLFIGIGALFGSTCMFIDPSGSLMKMDTLLPYFKVLPLADILFRNYIFSGFALLIVNGISNFVATYFLLRNKKIGNYLGMTFGITLMLWICIQFYMFPVNFMDITYFIFGLLQAITGYMCVVFYKQEHLNYDYSQYKNIGKDKTKLVVYFSRLGYTKNIAYKEADRIGADIVEVKTPEKTDGTLGFWWCGRFGMHRWPMKIEAIDNIESYDEVTIVSPIWVFSICAPIRGFATMYSGKIKKVNYIFVHYSNLYYKKTADDLDKLLGVKRTSFTSICTKVGKVKFNKNF